MLRLPAFRYHVPSSVAEAVRIKSDHGPRASYVSGGTDLFPNMKRRQQEPEDVVQVSHLRDLLGFRREEDGRLRIGAGETLTDVRRRPEVLRDYPALSDAVALVATPLLQNMGTIGGNVCLDTRCNYYDQSYEWRAAIDFCMKKDGDTCWVAPGSPVCLAVNSSDTTPVLVALGAEVLLSRRSGERTLPAAKLFKKDGIDYLAKDPNELLTGILLPKPDGWASSYVKLRRRGTYDFPVLGVAASLRRDGPGGDVAEARIVLGAVASSPLEVPEAAETLTGRPLSEESIAAAAHAAWRPAKPMDNTDFLLSWRKEMVRQFVIKALRRLLPPRP